MIFDLEKFKKNLENLSIVKKEYYYYYKNLFRLNNPEILFVVRALSQQEFVINKMKTN